MEPDDQEQDAAELRCRICLETEVNEFISMFCVASTQKKLLAHMTLACAGVPISMCDRMPQVICDKCLGNLDIAYACWRRCRESWGDYVRDPALKDEEEDFRCRICLRMDVEELISVYCICDSQLLKINEMVKQYSGVEVKEDDGRPQYICESCLSELNVGFEFRKLCRQTNVKLRLELQAKEPTNVIEESDSESLPEADQDNRSPTPPPPEPEPTKVQLKKIAQRRMSMKKVVAKPELPATVQITRLDIPEVVPGSFKRKVFSSASEFKEFTKQILNKPKEPTPGKKTTFSSPSEFKELANKIISKTKEKEKATKNSPLSSTLMAFEIRVLTDSEQYTYSEVFSFKCSSCNSRNPLQTIGVTCCKCMCSFENYLVVRPHRGQPHMLAYCCTECNYFSRVLSSMAVHIRQHQSKEKPPPMVMRNLVIPLVPVPIEPIAMKEETMEAPERDDHPDPLETVFVEATTKKAAENGAKRVGEPLPDGQSKKVKANSDTFDVLIELDQSEAGGSSEAESAAPGRASSEESAPPASKSTDQPIDIDGLFDTLLEAERYNILFLKGALCCGCTKFFPSQEALKQHLAKDHDKRRFNVNEITCNTCMTKCRSVRDVGYHQLLATKKIFYFCKICPRILLTEEDFESHRLDCHESLPEIDTNSDLGMLVKRAKVIENRKPVTVPKKLRSDDESIFKLLQDSAQYRILLLQGHLCCQCQLVFSSISELRLHRLKHRRKSTHTKLSKYQCEKCNDNCRTDVQLAGHRLKAAKRLYYACKLCRGVLLENDDDFETHRARFHPTVEIVGSDLSLGQTKMLLEKNE